MINKDKNLLSFTTKQKNEYRSELMKQNHHTDPKKKGCQITLSFGKIQRNDNVYILLLNVNMSVYTVGVKFDKNQKVPDFLNFHM